MADDSLSHHHSQAGVQKNTFYASIAILAILILASVIYLNNKIDQAGAGSSQSDLSAQVSGLNQRLSAVEAKLTPPSVTLTLFYDANDAFTAPALKQVASAQTALAAQGLQVQVQDVSSNLTKVRREGFSSLPALYLPLSEAQKNPTLYQAVQLEPQVLDGFRIPTLGFLTSMETMLGLNCNPGNNSARFYEFSNPESPASAQAQPELNATLAKFGSKLQFQFRQYPASDAPLSENASEAFECAKQQGAADAFGQKLFSTLGQLGEWEVDANNQTQTSAAAVAKFVTYAGALGMNTTQFSECLSSQQPVNDVTTDVAEGVTSYGIPQKSRVLPIFVVDCKYVFGYQNAGDINASICRARPDLC